MKKTTKIISLLITLAMMIAMAVPMTVSASFSDVASDHHYYDAIHNLSAEGILNGFEDGSFKPGDPVTRAQFTKIICYALSVGNLTYSDAEKSIFTDVAPDHWAADNIVTAYKQKIINGMGDGTFAPEAGVNYEQAVKMVVCALGYSPERAEALGGYPGGYMSLANSAKILTGITDAKMGQTMNRGAVAQLIDNMKDADQIIDGQPSGSIREDISTSKKFDGRVVAAYNTVLRYGDVSPCMKNQILVEGATDKIFDVSELDNFDINKYLGRSVSIYYTEESDVVVDVVSSIALQSRKNEEIKIDLDLICDYNSTSIEYYKDSSMTETEKISYETSSDNILNGEPVDDDLATIIGNSASKTGYILLINSTTSGAFDTAFIKTYDMMVVSYVDRTNKKVYAKNAEYTDGSIVLDVENRNKDIVITKDGKDAALSTINENTILSISKSDSGNTIEVLIGSGTASGIIVSTANNNTQITLKSSNKVYTLLDNFYVPSGSSRSDVAVGRNVTLSFDAFGKVARVVFAAESSYNYGYLSALEPGTMHEPEIRIMLYKPSTSNSKLSGIQYKFANKVKVNGQNYTVEDDMNTIVDIIKDGAEVSGINPDITGIDATTNAEYAQPIRYSLDTNGLINAIATNQSTETDSTKRFDLDKHMTTAIECTLDGTNFGSTYRISSSTPVIYIPANRVSDEYSSKSNNFFKKGTSYYVQFANKSSTGLVSCVYIYGIEGGSVDTATITAETTPMIVKDIVPQESYYDGYYKKFILQDVISGVETPCYDKDFEGTDALDTLTIGDVVRIAADDDKFVQAVEVLADAEAVAAKTFNYEGVYVKTQGDDSGTQEAEFRTLIGTIKTRYNYDFTVVGGYDPEANGGESYTASQSIPVYMIDTTATLKADKVKTAAVLDLVGTSPDATLASKVMLYTSEAQIKAIIIFYK